MMMHASRLPPSPTVTFWGAAQSVTGSMHLVEADRRRVLLDCGMFRGRRGQSRGHNSVFPFDPPRLDAVVLSHAHVDHCGNLPNLVRQGFAGPIFCTPATRDLLSLVLADSARIQEHDAREHNLLRLPDEPWLAPLYTRDDVERTVRQCVPVGYGRPHPVCPGVELRLADAGHILGSAMVTLTVGGRTVTFTGDLGRRGLPFLRDPEPVPAA